MTAFEFPAGSRLYRMPEKLCGCGCGRFLPLLRGPNRKFFALKCRNRVAYLKHGQRRQLSIPWSDRRRLGIEPIQRRKPAKLCECGCKVALSSFRTAHRRYATQRCMWRVKYYRKRDKQLQKNAA